MHYFKHQLLKQVIRNGGFLSLWRTTFQSRLRLSERYYKCPSDISDQTGKNSIPKSLGTHINAIS